EAELGSVPKLGGRACPGMIWESRGSNFRSSVGNNLIEMACVVNAHQLWRDDRQTEIPSP
ncbi:MAG: hypothetical protein MI975_04875, partial [Cytophagales bacterium]|nr:hypothetical protein [Cytophagales bacterium]